MWNSEVSSKKDKGGILSVDNTDLHSMCEVDKLKKHKTGEEAKEMRLLAVKSGTVPASNDVFDDIKRNPAASYRELEARRNRVSQLEKLYMDMVLQKELQKAGRKRKLLEDEIVCHNSKPAYKWRPERKRFIKFISLMFQKCSFIWAD
ncbi:putative U3 small nucleolar RNA-associated protein 11 [Morella rubra]|uniref:Putative U3 small nucleolar RNA-associated protein 11 n=1 Tax=Morella rubra TaxID=262757 RepID=A0A6A1VJN0_9ROSI|nr:putative U3 small nucleolar RNA-associated protein 11 [Morella rubra]